MSNIKLARISEDQIVAEASKDSTYCQLSVDIGLWAAQAQLEADQEKVKAIFEEIEEHLFTFNGDGNLILTSAPPRDRIVIWWQALKQKYLKEAKR